MFAGGQQIACVSFVMDNSGDSFYLHYTRQPWDRPPLGWRWVGLRESLAACSNSISWKITFLQQSEVESPIKDKIGKLFLMLREAEWENFSTKSSELIRYRTLDVNLIIRFRKFSVPWKFLRYWTSLDSSNLFNLLIMFWVGARR